MWEPFAKLHRMILSPNIFTPAKHQDIVPSPPAMTGAFEFVIDDWIEHSQAVERSCIVLFCSRVI